MTSPGRLIRHTALVDCEKELMRKLDGSKPGDIHFLVGMPGAGKSEVRYSVMNKLAGDPSKWGRGRLPIACVRAAPTDRSLYCPKDMHKRLLLCVQEPDFDWLKSRDKMHDTDIVHLQADALIASKAWQLLRPSQTGHGMRIAFEQSARKRGMRVLYIEQGSALTFVPKSRSPADNMNSLMCLAEEVPLILVVVGTPRMRVLWASDGEVRRRSTFTYFHRYQWKEAVDRENAYRLSLNLTKRLKFKSDAVPSKHHKLAYVATLAIFDEMKKFYDRAEGHRILSGAECIGMHHLKAAVLPEEELKSLYSEAKAFDEMSAPCSLRLALKLLEPSA
jgi:hypothetical protein